ncbi:MAG: hypothetical protein IKP61_06340 [Spirochaetales bacterium]|nr:hypothetical protein [Spirochaetales bacterium]
MKKITAFLIMILLIACTVFAEGQILVQSRVKAEISLDTANTDSAGGLYRLCLNDEEGAPEASSYIIVDADVSKQDITVDFLIKQSQTTRTNESIVISVSATPLEFMDAATNQKYSSSDFSFEAMGDPSLGEEYIEVTKEISEREQNTLLITIKYKGSGMPVEKGTTIATFTAKWAKNEELVEHPGVYTADLTLKYVIN